jgi:CBS-domain-containing membrane protein
MSKAAHPPAATAQDLMREWRVTLPPGMSVAAAVGLLTAVGADAAPVVDSDGRCVGLFTSGDYRRRLAGEAPVPDVFSAGQMVATGDKVRDLMTRRFCTATPEVGISELLLRLRAAADPFLVVLDQECRPVGVVCGLDVIVAEANAARPRKRVWAVEVV